VTRPGIWSGDGAGAGEDTEGGNAGALPAAGAGFSGALAISEMPMIAVMMPIAAAVGPAALMRLAAGSTPVVDTAILPLLLGHAVAAYGQLPARFRDD